MCSIFFDKIYFRHIMLRLVDAFGSTRSHFLDSSRNTSIRKLSACCGGRCVLSLEGQGKFGIAFGTIQVIGVALWAVTAAFWPMDPVWIGIGVFLHTLSISAYILLEVSDPGVLPKHVTTLFGKPYAYSVPPDREYSVPIVADVSPVLVRRSDGGATGGTVNQPCMVKFCITCRIWRPAGTHHCSECNVCVLGFDHHCGVVGKCIGAGNIRAFLLFEYALALCQGYSLVYALVAAIAGMISLDTESAVNNSSWTTDSPRRLWIAGGVLLGWLVLAGTCLRRTCAQGAGLILALLVGVAGATCLLVAYSSVSPTSGRTVPALLSLPLFTWTVFMATSTAVGQTCIVASRETTKGRLREAEAVAARQGAQVNTFTPVSTSAPGLSCSSRMRSLAHLACSQARARDVHFYADVRNLQKAVKDVQKRIALEAAGAGVVECNNVAHAAVIIANPVVSEVSSCSGEAQAVVQEHGNTALEEWEAACMAAFAASLDSAYLDDAIRVSTDPVVVSCAQGIKGVLTGCTFLIPSVDYSALAAEGGYR